MSLSFCVLGSGSAGNSTLLCLEGDRFAPRYALIDAGLSPRRTARALEPLGLELDDLSDIFLTHLDTDHFYHGWLKRIEKHDLAVHVHRRHRSIALRCGLTGRRLAMFDDGFELDDATRVEPVLLAHDHLGTVGYVIEHDGTRLGFATDLGRVPDVMLRRFRDLHALAIESNYDPRLQLASARPVFVKRRIMGGAGHLSNEQAHEAVTRIDGQSDLAHVVLLHLSRECNDPRTVKTLYARRGRHLLDRLTITSQYRPTPLLRVVAPARNAPPQPRLHPRRGQQLAMC